MTTKRTKYRVGPFERVHISADLDSPGDFGALVETIEAASPQGQISTWRPHADRLRIAGDLLDQAEALIGQDGQVAKIDRFDGLMSQARLLIERAQNESMDVYGLAASRARQNAQLRTNATAENERKKQESREVNAKLVAWDDEIRKRVPRQNQTQRAQKILKDYNDQLPSRIAQILPESLAKRIRKARK